MVRRAWPLRLPVLVRAGALIALLGGGVVVGTAVAAQTGPTAAKSPPAEQFLGYWSAYGQLVGQLQRGQTYGWGPTWNDDNSSVGSVRPDYSGIDVRTASATIALQAHTDGDRYAYKPLLTDRGITPTAAWFASYYSTVLAPVITGAPATEPDLIVLETELDGAIGPSYDAGWRELIAKVRAAGYTGKLLGTSSNRYIAGWWDDVDYVGGDVYPPIDTTSLASATQSWEDQVGWQVAAYHAGSGKPVLWGEMGSYQGSMTTEQWHNYLYGLFDAMRTQPAWAGALFYAGYEGFSATHPTAQSATAPPVPSSDQLAGAAARWMRPGPASRTS